MNSNHDSVYKARSPSRYAQRNYSNRTNVPLSMRTFVRRWFVTLLIFLLAHHQVTDNFRPHPLIDTHHASPTYIVQALSTHHSKEIPSRYDDVPQASNVDTVLIESSHPPPSPDGTLLVSTLDGTLHGLDLRSGEYLWSFGAGASLLHSSFESEAKKALDRRAEYLEEDEILDDDGEPITPTIPSPRHQTTLPTHEQVQADLNNDLASGNLEFTQDEDPSTPNRHPSASYESAGNFRAHNGSTSPLMIPGVDGSLFYSGTHGLQRLPINVAELVEASPFKTGDNTRYLGFKETNVFLIHRNTGQLKRVFSPKHSHKFSLSEDCDEDECDPNLIWVAKTDLTVHAIDGRNGKLRWNVSISTYSPFDNTDSVAELSESELSQLGYPEIGVSVSGTVHAVDVAAHRILWSQPLHSPVTSVFLLRPEQPTPNNNEDDSENINIQLNHPDDMIKLPHFYFDFDSDNPTSTVEVMLHHYQRSRDLSDTTTFTYIGQTRNGLIYALPNPSPAKQPIFIDGKLTMSTSNDQRSQLKPTRGQQHIGLISDGKPQDDVLHILDQDATCIPTSKSYPQCLIGFHALHSGAGSTSNQRLIEGGAASREFFNKSVKPVARDKVPHQPPNIDLVDEDDEALSLVGETDKVIVLPPPPPPSPTHDHSPPSFLPFHTDSMHFWWPVLTISVILSVVISTTMVLLQRFPRRWFNGNGKNKKEKKSKRNNNSPSTTIASDPSEDQLIVDDKDDGSNSLRKRNGKKDPRSVAPERSSSESISSTASSTVSPNSSGTLVQRKTHFSTYESDSSSLGVGSSSQSGETKSLRPRKHIQSRPDTRLITEDVTLAATNHFATPVIQSDGSVAIGTMAYHPSKVLGTGSMGTVVYKGTFGGRPCAIKRLVKPFFGSANAAQEISLLIQSDQHPNVLRYYAKEEDTSFIYLALEECMGTIQDLVDDNRQEPLTLEQTKAVLYGMMTGLAHLHSLHIVHRDIKPGNILLSRGPAKSLNARVSDMGLGKQLSMSRSSFDSVVSGSIGWQAPEVLNANGGRLTKAVDVFSAGCVMHYVLTKGKHPFGDNVERELNIAHNRMDLSGLSDLPEARDLIGCCLHPDPSLRMSAEDVCAHPFFWSPEKQLSFLLEASDRFESEPEHSEMRMCLESQAAEVVGENWHLQLNQNLLDNLNKYRKYNTSSVRDALRVIRNKKNHFRDLPPEVRAEIGPIPDGYLRYFTERFPALLIYIYSVLSCFCLESPASSRGDQYSYSPFDLDHFHTASYDADLRVESIQQFYHKPLRDYPELRFSSPQFEPFYSLISLRRLVQLQKHTRLRFRHWNVTEDRWIEEGKSKTSDK